MKIYKSKLFVEKDLKTYLNITPFAEFCHLYSAWGNIWIFTFGITTKQRKLSLNIKDQGSRYY